jgi:hypothetical protein
MIVGYRKIRTFRKFITQIYKNINRYLDYRIRGLQLICGEAFIKIERAHQSVGSTFK